MVVLINFISLIIDYTYNPRMALEKECDRLLAFIEQNNLSGVEWRSIPDSLIWDGPINSNNLAEFRSIKEAVLAVLMSEGFVQLGIHGVTIVNGTSYFITDKGRAFLYTDTFVERSKRWQLEREYKRKEIEKISHDINISKFHDSTKKWSFWLSVFAIILSVIAIFISWLKN